MSFSYKSCREIWKRFGGRELAACASCGVAYKDGYNLDCSHLDHAKGDEYDNPERGILECLRCHLKRHVSLYFKACCLEKKKKIKQERFACLTISYRIILGEGKWTNDFEISKDRVAGLKRAITNVIKTTVELERDRCMFEGFRRSEIKKGVEGVTELLIYLD